MPLHYIIGKTDRDFFSAEQAEKYEKDDRRVLETGDVIECEEEHQSINGTTLKWMHVIKRRVIDPVTGAKSLQGIFMDVTDRVNADVSLEAYKQFLLAVHHSVAGSLTRV